MAFNYKNKVNPISIFTIVLVTLFMITVFITPIINDQTVANSTTNNMNNPINENYVANVKQSSSSLGENSLQSISSLQATTTPIIIYNNTDFATQAVTNLWSGNGSASNPYIISGYNINNSGTSTIQIYNTNVFFTIIGNTLSSGSSYAGIYLSNVTNAMIYQNYVSNGLYGIYLINTTNSLIISNTASNNNDGFFVFQSYNNSLIGNNGSLGTDSGLVLENSYNNTVSNGFFNNNTNYGINVAYSSNNTITSNVLNYNADGIYLQFSPSNVLVNNFGSFNSLYGIILQYPQTVNNIIENNTCPFNWEGILLDKTAFNIVTNNYAYNNTDYGFYVSNSNNNFFGNNTATFNSKGGLYSNTNTQSKVTSNYFIGNPQYGINLINSNNSLLSYNVISDTNTSFSTINVHNSTFINNMVTFFRVSAGTAVVMQPGFNTTYSDTVPFGFHADDPVLKSTTIYIDGVANTTSMEYYRDSTTVMLSNISVGQHNITIVMTDYFGNYHSVQTVFIVTINNTNTTPTTTPATSPTTTPTSTPVSNSNSSPETSTISLSTPVNTFWIILGFLALVLLRRRR